MKYEYLIFDLDGTISNPKEGIVKSINFALEYHGFERRSEKELCTLIGSQIDVAVSSLTGTNDTKLISSLIKKYRERYSDVGYSENSLYDGIVEVLKKLSLAQGVKLGICTSKRVDFAKKILEFFSLQQHFSFINGGDVGIEKQQQLASLLEQGQINRNSVMIGDRYVDITAAQKNNLHSAGVLWGFGSHRELSQNKPSHLFSNRYELMELIA